MHRQFIRTMATHTPYDDWQDAEFRYSEGVEGWYHKLARFTKQMVQPPNKYQFKKHFVEGLPTSIHNRLFNDYVTAESHTLVQIREHAILIERKNDMLKPEHNDGRSSRSLGGNCSSHQPQSSQAKDILYTSPMGQFRTNSGSSSRPRDGQSYSNNRSKDTGRSPTNRPSQNRDTPRTSGFNRNSGNQLQCFGCGSYEHLHSDPKCPQYGKPALYPSSNNRQRVRFQAGRLEDGDDEGVDTGHKGDEEGERTDGDDCNSFEGSPYDPKEEVQYKDGDTAPDANEDAEANSEGEGDICFGQMRI